MIEQISCVGYNRPCGCGASARQKSRKATTAETHNAGTEMKTHMRVSLIVSSIGLCIVLGLLVGR
ncbi:MAG: hypothetical protein VX859_04710, partial [Pseudomonadota bacterium]|nr:hypothetical protein [Pseudomonadota bacterium]